MASIRAKQPIQAGKAEIRALARSRRAKAAREAPDAGRALVGIFRRNIRLAAPAVIAGYLPIGDEIDVRPLLDMLRGAGHEIALPRVVRTGGPLDFAVWRDGDGLDDGPFGTRQPTVNAAAVIPGLVIVPMLAFDPAGVRLGYGGGYYDRTLAALRRERAIVAIGVAYAGQEMVSVPHDAHDQRLDWVITERAAIEFGKDC